MSELDHPLEYFGYPPLPCHCFGTSGMIDFPQLSTSSFNHSSTADADGRLLDSGPSSTTQVATSDSHNASENPEAGLLGRSPSITLYITVTFRTMSLNGRHPVKTSREVGSIFQWVETRTHLKNCHPNCIDVRAHGWESFRKLAREPKLLRKQQLWSHPPIRSPQSAVVSGTSSS